MKTNKIELLAPCGSMEALIAAVNNGADAVYLGGVYFGARAFANNFNHENIIKAINFCHLRGVLVYVTMNTILYENEIKKAMEEVDFYYKNNVDAIIVQDLGLFHLIRKMYPDLEIHCSTQMHVHNVEGVKFMKKMGANRVVIARETPINIIKECVETGIEIEVFSYGALCVSYSGQCLISSVLQNRSGNRGVCAQHCRMQYKVVDNNENKTINTDEYLLSPKDLNIINDIDKLIEIGVKSLKIEGRMKRSEYVGLVVSIFRKTIDSYYEGKKYTLSDEDLKKLKLMFNRGFTSGKIFDDNDNNFMNQLRGNHIGINIGKVVNIDKKFIYIKFNENINQNDGIRILNNIEDYGTTINKLYFKGKLVSSVLKNNIACIDKKDSKVKIGDIVVKTTDYLLNENINKENLVLKRKIKLKAKVIGKVNERLILNISDGINNINVSSNEICQKAINQPINKEKIIEQLNKTNDSVYEFNNFDINIDDIFISIKEINNLRRTAFELMDIKRINKYNRISKKEYVLDNLSPNITHFNMIQINDDYKIENAILFSNSSNVLKCNTEINYISFPVNEKNIYNYNTNYFIASEIGALNTKHKNLIAGFNLNVTNSYALEFLFSIGCKCVIYSLELNMQQIKMCEEAFYKRFNFYPNTALFVYGKRDLMLSKQKIVYNGLSKEKLNLKNSFSLLNLKKQKMPLIIDDLGITHVVEEKPYIYTDEIICNNLFIKLTTKDDLIYLKKRGLYEKFIKRI